MFKNILIYFVAISLIVSANIGFAETSMMSTDKEKLYQQKRERMEKIHKDRVDLMKKHCQEKIDLMDQQFKEKMDHMQKKHDEKMKNVNNNKS